MSNSQHSAINTKICTLSYFSQHQTIMMLYWCTCLIKHSKLNTLQHNTMSWYNHTCQWYGDTYRKHAVEVSKSGPGVGDVRVSSLQYTKEVGVCVIKKLARLFSCWIEKDFYCNWPQGPFVPRLDETRHRSQYPRVMSKFPTCFRWNG